MNKEKEKNKKIIDADDDVIVVTEVIKIEDGKHTGTITNITRRPPTDEFRYDYTDITIKVTDHKKEPEINTSFPTHISESSGLGRLLILAGMDFEVDDEIKMSDIKTVLKDKKITFLSKNEKTDKGEFSRILKETIEFID